MDYYFVLKFLHVLLIIIWLGGGFGLVILGIRADRARSDSDLITVIQQVIFMAKIFVPAGLGALVLGLIMVVLNWSFGALWVIVGLIGFALTFGTGLLVLKPRSERVGAIIAKDGVSPAAVEQAKQILQIAKFDFVMLFIVVADMVIKPTAENYVTLTIMALALIVAAVAFHGPALRMNTARAGS
jgi:uncharacterized membrane protein